MILICFLIISQSVFAYGEPQWNEFCPPEYVAVNYKEKIKRNAVLKPLAVVGQICTLNIIPIYWAMQKRDAKIIENNYWVQRKQQFNNEIEMCKQYSSNDSKLSCYMNVRQLEFNKTAQYENLMVAQEQMRLQRLQYVQQIQTNSNLNNINSNLNYRRYGY